MGMGSQKEKRKKEETGKTAAYLSGDFLNFRRIWVLSFLLTAGFAIIPVIFFAVMDYNLTLRSMEQDAETRTERLASNTWRTVSFFLDERKNALSYVAHSYSLERLENKETLSSILSHLKESFTGFTDIGVIGPDGRQITYAGPHGLTGRDYSSQAWFRQTIEQGSSVSDVFLGYRNVPHISIAVRHETGSGQVFILRATIEHQLPHILSQIRITDKGDAFLTNADGVLQTPSSRFGKVFDEMKIPLPPKSDETKVITLEGEGGEALIAAYRYIPSSPFVLMVVKSKKSLMAPWHESRMELLKYVLISITIILVWIGGVTSYLVQRLKLVDRKRAKYLHLAEYANKMASIGRLAAGVAHEINNPLAIINEKAGMVKDMMRFKKGEFGNEAVLSGILDTIIESVERCSKITRQLLSFGRHTGTTPEPLTLATVLNEVLVFLTKEAEFRKINVDIDLAPTLPKVVCDRGKLQQILLNIINNAFSAISPGGMVKISGTYTNGRDVALTIEDNGCGISEKDLKDIYEPFFSTKVGQGGTGLGLSITYGLVQEMGGHIEVASRVGQGTTFIVFLPTQKEEGI